MILKKLLFCLGVLVVGNSYSFYEDRYPRHGYVIRDNYGIPYGRLEPRQSWLDRNAHYIVGGCVGLVVAVYLWNRESNGSVACQVKGFHRDLSCNFNFTTPDLVVALDKNLIGISEREQIFKLKHQMIARYGSWIKPWDWSLSMQKAYEQPNPIHA
jgi:hypothetical protein